MTDDADERQDQRKVQSPPASGASPAPEVEAVAVAPDTTDAPEPTPDADQHPAQVKAVTQVLASSVPVADPAAPVVPRIVPRPSPPVATVAPSAPTAPSPPLEPAADADAAADDLEDDPEIAMTLADRLRRLSPALVILSILSIGSLIFLALAMTSHITPVPVLLSSAVVTGLAFAVDAVVASFMTWKAGQDGRAGKALMLAMVGGISAVIAAGAFAGTLILALLLKG
jgi:hypothetical protein